MKNKHPLTLGCCVPIDFDIDTDLGFIVPVKTKTGFINCRFKVMVHPLSDGDGVKLWFSLEEVVDDGHD